MRQVEYLAYHNGELLDGMDPYYADEVPEDSYLLLETLRISRTIVFKKTGMVRCDGELHHKDTTCRKCGVKQDA